MRNNPLNTLIAFSIGSSLLFGSTAAAASTAASWQLSPWAALTALSAGAPAAALCGASSAAVAAGQPSATGCVLPAIDAPPPVAEAAAPPAPIPAMAAPTGYAVSPLFLALGALAAG